MVRRVALALSALALGCSSTEDPFFVGGGGGGPPTDARTSEDAPSEAGSDAATGSDVASEAAKDSAPGKDATSGPGLPPFGGSSAGTGGAAGVPGTLTTAGGVSYNLLVPGSYSPATPIPLLVAFSGTEGGGQMTTNLQNLGPSTGTSGFIEAVLDGVTYRGNGAAGATVLDDVRARYNIDNDRTYLLGESAGTTAALQLGFHLKQSYFAAYWANDVNAADAPAQNAAQLGFAPWGQAGPGGDVSDATAIVTAEQAAGYRLPSPAPYAGPGSTTHGDPNQFIAALTWLPGKQRL
jgi:hypothetical protein